MARSVDLSLDALKIAGLPNYLNEFGTKKSDGVGLSTEEITNNDLLSYKLQRAIIVDEDIDCTGHKIERDTKFIVTSAGLTITIGKADYAGCHLTFICTFPESSAKVLVSEKNKIEYKERFIFREAVYQFYSDKDGYFTVLH